MGNQFSADLARSNVHIREKRFSGEIKNSIERAARYTLADIRRNKIDISSCGDRDYCTHIDVCDSDIRYHIMVMLKLMVGRTGRTAVLNPGDYTLPGGGYIVGDRGYEETICSNTILYEVLKECSGYYSWNANHLNNGLYTNVCLYTPDIQVVDNSGKSIGAVDVITCSAPNYDEVPKSKANKAIKDRIELIFNVAVRNNIKHMILSGFGCGYERSDVEYIASVFNEMCILYRARFDTITFIMGTEARKETALFKEALGLQI